MFHLFESYTKRMKGYKITTKDRTKKIGVAAKSLKILREKACNKFKMKNCKLFIAKDGTEVDDEDYFDTLDEQTVFVVAADSDEIKTDFELMYEAIRDTHSNILDAGDIIRNFVKENRAEFDKFLKEFQNNAQESSEKIVASLRDDHTEWFEGISSNLITKEEVMSRRSQDRIRGYFYKTKEDLTKSDIYKKNKSARQIIDKVLECFKIFLIGTDYFSTLFDRKCDNKHRSLYETADDIDGETPKKKLKQAIYSAFENFSLKNDYCVSLCTDLGEFRCHGLWDDTHCSYSGHCINPYSSRENVILFQIWNLDHQIEISRSVIPSVLEHVEQIVSHEAICVQHKRPAVTITILRYFLELFTMENLKLVHIVCHDKGSHTLKSKGGVICNKCSEYKTLEKILKKVDIVLS